MMKNLFRAATFLFLVVLWAAVPALLRGQAIYEQVPEPVDPAAKYLIFLHGKIIEERGIPRPKHPGYGYYEYQLMLETFRDRGFTVISAMRPKNANVAVYAGQVAGQVTLLLKNGVPPRQITVLGASKGGVIAMLDSARLKNRDLHFVFMSCGYPYIITMFQQQNWQLWGRILSIFDQSEDTGAGSIQELLAPAAGKSVPQSREIVLKMGLGHGILYQPFPEWVEPVIAWASDKMTVAKTGK
jgi:hypothetical protein